MEADNLSVEQLAGLIKLARSKQVKVYVAFNTTIKDNEIQKADKILHKLVRYADPDALIIQDPAMVEMARRAGFKKEFHLSTLGNCTFASGLNTAKKMGFSRVVMPREFTIDDIKAMADRTPEGLTLEMFIHGALCYSVSGRCYWSSWFGGKSALRGRCVQPCRRIYSQQGEKKRFFSCLDFSTDVLTKVLRDIPKVDTWKIEGRKKSPHYVYYTTRAYRLLRDHPKQKKEALSFLEYAMGRPFSHYNLLTHRKMNPLDHDSQTGSGLFAGRTKNPSSPFFITREALYPGDLVRIGYEDSASHDIQRITRAVPKKGKFYLSGATPKKSVAKGTPVYLIDRRDQPVAQAIEALELELKQLKAPTIRPFNVQKTVPQTNRTRKLAPVSMTLSRQNGNAADSHNLAGLWISSRGYRSQAPASAWLWLDPLIFPEEEQRCTRYISTALKKGNRHFVINALWQLAFFTDPGRLNIWAGPFCNITNRAQLDLLRSFGVKGAFASPELDSENFLEMGKNSPIAMGAVVYGNWPLGISRTVSGDIKLDKAFKSPMGETAWISKRNDNYYLFPNWLLDLREKQNELIKAGYTLFVDMKENIPKAIKMKKRQGLWNWNNKLL